MGNFQEINYSVIIKNDPDDDTLNLLNLYWYFDNGLFPNKPKDLSAEKDFAIRDLFNTIKEYSHVLLKCTCKTCETIVEHEVTSQSSFLHILRNKPLCETCKEIQKEKFAEERKKERERWKQQEIENEKKFQREINFSNAIERFEKTRFNKDEARFILNFIQNHGNIVSWAYYINNCTTYHKFMHLELIDIEENSLDRYVTITYSEQLEVLLNDFLHTETEISNYKEQDSNSWSRLSFHLEKNKSYRNSNTPRFSGTIIFKEDIIIKKGTKCLYGVWDRDHDDAWLSLTPTSDIIVAKNKPIHKEPEHIGNILNRFLDNPENREY